MTDSGRLSDSHRNVGGDRRAASRLVFALVWLVCGCVPESPAPAAPRAVSILLELLHDPDDEIRRNALESLGKIGDQSAAVPVVGLLRDQSASVRRAAATATGRVGAASLQVVVPALLESFNDPDAAVRQEAAQALGELDPAPALLDRVPDLLRAPDRDVRRAAALLLAEIDSTPWLPALKQALLDSDAVVRQRAVAALGATGAHQVIPWLVERLSKDPDAGVRAEAAYQLQTVANEDTRALLKRAAESDRDPVVRRWARSG